MPSFARVLALGFLAGSVGFGCSSAALPDAADGAVADASTEPTPGDASVGPGCAPVVASVSIESAIVSTDPATSKRVWIVRAREGKTNVTFTLREASGAAPGASSGAFGEEQLRPGAAATSFLLQTDCNAHGDHYHCGPSFVPSTGEWKVSALDTDVGGAFKVELSASMIEAKVSGGTARPVEGGKSLCVSALLLEGTLAAP